MAEPSNRFQLIGIPLTLERTIRDCRDLEEIVLLQKSTIESLKQEIETLKKKVD